MPEGRSTYVYVCNYTYNFGSKNLAVAQVPFEFFAVELADDISLVELFIRLASVYPISKVGTGMSVR